MSPNKLQEFIQFNQKQLNSLNLPKQTPKINKSIKIAVVDGSPYTLLCDFLTPVNYKTNRHYHSTLVSYIIKSINYLANNDNIEMYGISIYHNTESKWNFVDGVNWCIQNGINIINLSMNLPESNEIIDVVNKAYEKGIIICIAGGNTGNKMTFPSTLSNVIAVGALDGNDYNKRAYYSSMGKELDIASFGFWTGFTLMERLEDCKPLYASGTSFSDPTIAGNLGIFFALFYDKNNRFPTFDECIQFLSDNSIDLGVKGRDDEFGFGRFQWKDGYEVKKVEDGNIKTEPIQQKYWRVQVGAYKNKQLAINLQNQLKQQGITSIIKQVGNLYKLQLGCFLNETNGRKYLEAIKSKGFKDAFIVYN